MKLIIVFAAFLVGCLADKSACPVPDETISLIHEQRITISQANQKIDVPDEFNADHTFPCVSLLSKDNNVLPDLVGASNNRGGISIHVGSKVDFPIEAILYIYSVGKIDLDSPIDPDALAVLEIQDGPKYSMKYEDAVHEYLE